MAPKNFQRLHHIRQSWLDLKADNQSCTDGAQPTEYASKPYQRGVSEAPRSDPRNQAVELLQTGSTARQRAGGPAPAAPTEMAERQSCVQYLYLYDLYTGHCRFEIHFFCKFNFGLFVNSTLTGIHCLINSEFEFNKFSYCLANMYSNS